MLVGAVMGRGVFYYLTIGSVVAVLALSANTSFADFPRVCRVLAEDRFLPDSFAIRGRRLVYSQGIIVLAVLSGVLLVVFEGITDRLIPLFAIGALVAFTMSQAGMVAHWRREGGRQARHSLPINLVGAVTTGITAVAVAIAKFSEGAWIVVVILPLTGDVVLAHPRALRPGGRTGGRQQPARPRCRSRADRGRRCAVVEQDDPPRAAICHARVARRLRAPDQSRDGQDEGSHERVGEACRSASAGGEADAAEARRAHVNLSPVLSAAGRVRARAARQESHARHRGGDSRSDRVSVVSRACSTITVEPSSGRSCGCAAARASSSSARRFSSATDAVRRGRLADVSNASGAGPSRRTLRQKRADAFPEIRAAVAAADEIVPALRGQASILLDAPDHLLRRRNRQRGMGRDGQRQVACRGVDAVGIGDLRDEPRRSSVPRPSSTSRSASFP